MTVRSPQGRGVKIWNPLKTGDIIDVVAPGYASTAAELDGARRFLLSWGLVPRIPPGMISPHFLHANEDAERFHFLKKALLAEDSAAVWCLRGGYGSNRLLPMLAKVRQPRKNKLFIGISDITSLHVFLGQEWKWPTIHGPLLDRLGAGRVRPRQLSEVKKLVFGGIDAVDFAGLKPLNEAARQVRRLEAPMIGGNLIVLQSTLGTPWQVDARGRFLFLEDLGERGYRVDRVLEHFAQAGVLRGCRGVFLGEFMGGDEANGSNLIPAVFKRWARELKIPLFAGLPAGHGVIQRPVPFGPKAQLTGGSSFRLHMPTGVRS